MPYDVGPITETHTFSDLIEIGRQITEPRARLEFLRDFIRAMPEKRLNIGFWWANAKGHDNPDMARSMQHDCGTVGCIGGWADVIWGEGGHKGMAIAEALGLSRDQAHSLFHPPGWEYLPYTPQEAAAAIQNMLDTGSGLWPVAAIDAANRRWSAQTFPTPS